MLRTHHAWCQHHRRGRSTVRLRVEALESRDLPSSLIPLPVFVETTDHATLDQAQELDDLSATGGALVQGTIAGTASGAGEVDWYRFSLSQAATVSLRTLSGGTLGSVLSLYNSDPFDFSDYYDPFHHRLLAQDDGLSHDGNASLGRSLAPGTYFVAVSGSGNRYFSPYLPESGYAGATGSYQLQVTAAGLGLGPDDGPQVLAADPSSGAALPQAPLAIRVNFSTPLDPGSVDLGNNIRLTFNPTSSFGSGLDQPIDLAGFNLNTAQDELQLAPAVPLGPGFYRLHLARSLTGAGIPLGAHADSLGGKDFSLTFRVYGVEGATLGGAPSDDTPAGAHELGDITAVGVRTTGAIGDDPADPVPFNPADVDLYHFSVSGVGRYALTAEAFARRIGSPLDVSLSLFQFSAVDNQLHVVAANDNTLNDTVGTNGTLPLFSDSVLFAGLTAGDYYLAVSSRGNVPDPASGLLPGVAGIFDPNVSHSGLNGSSTGPYVLNLAVQPDNEPPQVVSVTPAAGANLAAPPTELVVQFSESINLRVLAYQAYQHTASSLVQAVYVEAADGTHYVPRLQSWDEATHQATFLMLDGLPNGDYQLHLSGPLGLADFAGNPLVGNDASGDFVVPFTVNGPERGSAGDPLTWDGRGGNNAFDQPQVLGALYPHELDAGAGVTIARAGTLPVTGTADFYQFQVLQTRPYYFDLTGSGLTGSATLALFDANGNAVPDAVSDNGQIHKAVLPAGTYVIQVGSWAAGQVQTVAYRLHVMLGGANENPTPLTVGPAPVLRLGLSDLVPGAPPPVNSPTTAHGSNSTTDNGPIPASVLLSLGGGPIGGVSGEQARPAAQVAFFTGSDLLGRAQVASAAPAAAPGGTDGPTLADTGRVANYPTEPEGRRNQVAKTTPQEAVAALPLPAAASPLPHAEIGPYLLPEGDVPAATPVAHAPVGMGYDPWLALIVALSSYAVLRDSHLERQKHELTQQPPR